MLQKILPTEKLEISSKIPDKSEKLSETVIQVNLIEFYFPKICESIRSSFFIKDINSCYSLNLFIDRKNNIS